MYARNQWINWRVEDRGESKPAKVPYDATSGQRIDPHATPAAWLPYDLARALDSHIGFVLTDADPYFCIDLDHAYRSPGLDATGEPLPATWSATALDTLARFPGAYVEVSYSGDGLHIIARGTPPDGHSTRGPEVELYTRLRFIAITGANAQGDPDTDHSAALAEWAAIYLKPVDIPVPGALQWTTGPVAEATHIPDDADLIGKMLSARPSAGVAFGGKASAADLWAGDVEALKDAFPSQTDDYDRSAADGALAAHLAFWTGKDCERIVRLMRQSALVRDKWDRRGDDYLRRTVTGACARVQRVYTGPQVQQVSAEPYDYAYAEEELAARLVALSRDSARYVAPWESWYVYDGATWKRDQCGIMLYRARAVCNEIAASVKIDPQYTENQRSRIVTTLKKSGTISAVERIARYDPAMVASMDQWDTDPWLLNTPAGVVDLRTGEIRAPRANDYMTKITAVAPGGDCPVWRAYLHRVMDGNADLIAYLQRLAGYALTGSTREHVLPFAHGGGGNGKGVFIGTISKMMGDYHKATPIETFAASTHDQHPTALAALRGARLVTAQETEEGRRWAESRIKSLTGGDPIAARFMRQDFFEYDPQFTLLIAGNHKPGLRSVDEAIRRRFHLIPFAVTIPKAERDETLTDRLKDEWPGILAWTIEGCLAWQRIGLSPPDAVLSATGEYLDGQDAIGTWLGERTVREDDAFSTTAELYSSFRMWAANAGEFVLPRSRFIDALSSRGFHNCRSNHQRGFRGVRVITGILP